MECYKIIPKSKKYLGICLVAILLLSSCATILNRSVQKIYISGDKNVKIISVDKATHVDSSLRNMNAPKAYYVPRSVQPLKVTVQIDSTLKILSLRPRYSLAYWANLCFNYGIGILVDMDNVKHCGYKVHNYFTLENASKFMAKEQPVTKAKSTIIKKIEYKAPEKGQLNFSISFISLTNLLVDTIGGHKDSSGMIGLDVGLNYYYSRKNYLSANIGLGTDMLPLPIEYFRPHQVSRVFYANIRNNTTIGSFDIGYGVNISKYVWSLIMPSGKNTKTISNIGLGGSFSGEYRIDNSFRLGFLYQPNLLNTSFKPTINYQHYLSLSLILKSPLNKKSK